MHHICLAYDSVPLPSCPLPLNLILSKVSTQVNLGQGEKGREQANTEKGERRTPVDLWYAGWPVSSLLRGTVALVAVLLSITPSFSYCQQNQPKG